MVRKLKTIKLAEQQKRPILNWEEDSPPPHFVRKSSAGKTTHTPSLGSGKFLSKGNGARLFLVGIVICLALAWLFLRDRGPQPVAAMFVASATGDPYIQFPEISLDTRISYQLQRGDTLGSVVERHGLSADVGTKLQDALTALRTKENPLPLKAGKLVELRLDGEGGVNQLSFQSSADARVVVAKESKAGNLQVGYVARLTTIPQANKESVAFGTIKSSFAAAAKDVGVDYEIVDDLVDLFSDRIVFQEDFRVGDKFTVIYRSQVGERGEQIQTGPILAAALDVDGERFVAVRYVGTDGKTRYFDGKGKLLGNSFLRYPLQFSRISSYFTFSRFHPVLRVARPHNGVDFAAPVGTPVRSVANGKISFAGSNGSSGIMVKIDHNSRYSTAYLHLSKIAPGVSRGSHVEKGQLIGAVGQTGLATGPHLHYSFYDSGKYVDPLKVKLPVVDELNKGSRVPERYLERVLFTLEHYQGMDAQKLYGDNL